MLGYHYRARCCSTRYSPRDRSQSNLEFFYLFIFFYFFKNSILVQAETPSASVWPFWCLEDKKNPLSCCFLVTAVVVVVVAIRACSDVVVIRVGELSLPIRDNPPAVGGGVAVAVAVVAVTVLQLLWLLLSRLAAIGVDNLSSRVQNNTFRCCCC